MKLTTFVLSALLLFSFPVRAQTPPPPSCIPEHMSAVWSTYLFAGSHTASAAFLYCNLTITTAGTLYTPNPANPSRCYPSYDPDPDFSIPVQAAAFTLFPDCNLTGIVYTDGGSFTLEYGRMALDHLTIHGVGKDGLGTPYTVQAIREP